MLHQRDVKTFLDLAWLRLLEIGNGNVSRVVGKAAIERVRASAWRKSRKGKSTKLHCAASIVLAPRAQCVCCKDYAK